MFKRFVAWRFVLLCGVLVLLTASARAQANVKSQYTPTSFKFQYVCFVVELQPEKASGATGKGELPATLRLMQNGDGPDLTNEKQFVSDLEADIKGAKVRILFRGTGTASEEDPLFVTNREETSPYQARFDDKIVIEATSYEAAKVTQNGAFLYDLPGLSPKRAPAEKPGFGQGWERSVRPQTRFGRTYSMGMTGEGGRWVVYAYAITVAEPQTNAK